MTYVSYINQKLRTKLSATPSVVSFGQNIVTGSCLGGLTRGLPTQNGNMVINTTNSEYTLTGAGFGMMTEGVNGIFFMKQQDFLLLGMDHLVHTWNALRTRGLQTSFTIFAIVVDNGYEGPQSCMNNLSDFMSVSHIPGFTISNKDDADRVIDEQLVAPGVRFIGVSQRLFRTPLSTVELGGKLADPVNLIHKYGDGSDATIVSMNFGFSEAMRLSQTFADKGQEASVFNVPALAPTSWDVIIAHAQSTRHVVICDDLKGYNKPSTRLAYLLKTQVPECQVSVQERFRDDSWSWPNADKFVAEVHDFDSRAG